MTDDREAMANEIQRLRKARDRWMTAAAVALVLTFIVLTPLSFLLYEEVSARDRQEEYEGVRFWNEQYRAVAAQNQVLEKQNQALKKQLQEGLNK
jgi:cell division protein FtsB